MPAFPPLADALPPRNIRRLQRIQRRQLAKATQEVKPLVPHPQPAAKQLTPLQSYILRKQAKNSK